PAPGEQVAGTRSTRATDVKFVVIPSVVRPLAVYFTPIAILEVEAESAVHPAPDHAYVQQLEGLPVVLDSAVERKMRIEPDRRLNPDLADRPGRSLVDAPADGVLRPARPRRVVVAHGRLAVVADRRTEREAARVDVLAARVKRRREELRGARGRERLLQVRLARAGIRLRRRRRLGRRRAHDDRERIEQWLRAPEAPEERGSLAHPARDGIAGHTDDRSVERAPAHGRARHAVATRVARLGGEAQRASDLDDGAAGAAVEHALRPEGRGERERSEQRSEEDAVSPHGSLHRPMMMSS